MSIEGSQVPAELRMNQLMQRIDTLSGTASVNEYAGDQNVADPNADNFRALAAMMQAQMLGEALGASSNNESSNPMSSMMNMMMMGSGMGTSSPQALQMMQLMQGMQGASFPGAMGMPAINPNLRSSANDSGIVFPVNGRISSEYGDRSHPIKGHNHFHSGVDIAAPKGSPIRMPWSGTVVYVGNVQGFGKNTVIVAHEDQRQADGKIIYSVFGHNDDVFVRTGERVGQGEIFATVGSEGNSTGPHLHWETRVAPSGLAGTQVFNQHLSMTIDPMTFA